MSNPHLVPCDICEQLIHFDHYIDHITLCTQVYMVATPVLSVFFPQLSDGFTNLAIRASNVLSNLDPARGAIHNYEVQRVILINPEEDTPAFDQWVSDVLGSVHVGVDDVSAITSITTPSECVADSTCAICQDNLSIRIRRINKCGHCFCSECIETWLAMSKKCPLCMTRLDE